MLQDHPVINKYDIPAVWLAVLVEFFGKFPWPGVAAFLAAVYTLLRIIGICIRWWKGKHP